MRKTHTEKLISFAEQIYHKDQIKIERYEKWERYIVPLVSGKFNIKFELQYRYMVRKEIQEFIQKEETNFFNNN